ncbi:unnamed protein product, partial [Sphacelaria rigidula]
VVLEVVEALKNAMLACTFSMVVLGLLFLYAGFFIKVRHTAHTKRADRH